MTIPEDTVEQVWGWLMKPGVLMKELYKEFKESIEYTHLKNQIVVMFGKDQASIEFLLHDRPDWVSEDGRHYLRWLNDLTRDDVQRWADLGTGRIQIH